MDLGANTANFRKIWCVFGGGAEKKSEFTTELSFYEFGDVFLPKKNTPNFPKVRHVGSRVHQKLFKSARILSEEKIFGFLLGSACIAGHYGALYVSIHPKRRTWRHF